MNQRKRFQQIFAAHAEQVHGFFLNRVRRRDQAADLCHEVFLRLLRVKDLNTIDNPRAYVFRVAVNYWREYLLIEERECSQIRLSGDDTDMLALPQLTEEFTADDEIDVEKLVQRVRDVLPTLSERDREVLRLYYFEKLTYREIAQRWGVTKTAVEHALARAIVECKKRVFRRRAI